MKSYSANISFYKNLTQTQTSQKEIQKNILYFLQTLLMVMYNDLPIYKSCYELLITTTRLSKKLPQSYRYNVGQHLHNSLVELVITVFKANSFREERKQHLTHAREHIELVKLLIRLCKDLGGIPFVDYVNIQPLIENVSKQLTGWQKSS
jgi:hypothetical protein